MKPQAAVSNALEPISALIVAPRMQDILFAVRPLSTAHFDITVAETFTQAKALISARPPTLLITEVRLGEYNGLHLVLRGKGARADMAAVVTSAIPDAVIQAEAERLEATFVLTPTSEAELMAAALRTLFRKERTGPIRAPFERRSGDRRGVGAVPSAQEDRRSHERRRNLRLLSAPPGNS